MEAVEQLERQLRAYRLAGQRPHAFADDEPAAGREGPMRGREHVVEPAREMEHVDAPDERLGARARRPARPMADSVELVELERAARARRRPAHARRGAGRTARARSTRYARDGGEPIAGAQLVEQGLRGAAQPRTHLEDRRPRRRSGAAAARAATRC